MAYLLLISRATAKYPAQRACFFFFLLISSADEKENGGEDGLSMLPDQISGITQIEHMLSCRCNGMRN